MKKDSKQKAPYFHFRGNQASSVARCFGILKTEFTNTFLCVCEKKEPAS